jgi:hypothetical protein
MISKWIWILHEFPEFEANCLTEGVVRRYLALPVQLRRLYVASLPGLEPEKVRQDHAFYPFLTRFLNGDPSPILKFDRAMKRDRKDDKAFGLRAFRAIRHHFDGPIAPSERVARLAALCADETIDPEHRQLARFLAKLQPTDAMGGPREVAEDMFAGETVPDVTAEANPIALPANASRDKAADGPAGQLASRRDWQELVADLADLLTRALEPDPTIAERILASAGTLVVLAEAHRDRERARNQAIARLSALRLRLEDCLSAEGQEQLSLPDPLPEHLDPDALDTLVVGCETAARDLAVIERRSQELKDSLARANEADDVEAVSALSQQRLETNRTRQSLLTDRAEALNELIRGLATACDAVALAAAKDVDTTDLASEEPAMNLEPAHDLPEMTVLLDEVTPHEVAPDGADQSETAPKVEALTLADEDVVAEAGMALDPAAVGGVTKAASSAAEDRIEARPAPVLPLVPDQVLNGDDADGDDADGEDADGEDAAAVAEWTSDQGIDALLDHYLRRGDTLFAAQLLRLTEEKGVAVPVPATVVQALYESRSALHPHETLNPRLTAALDQAMAVLGEVEAGGGRGRGKARPPIGAGCAVAPRVFRCLWHCAGLAASNAAGRRRASLGADAG